MMKIFLGAVLGMAVVAGSSCKKDPVPEPEKQYNMPLEVGNKWIYEVYSVDTFGGSGNFRFLDTVEVLYKITRDMFPNNPSAALDILDQYDWYMVKGRHKYFGAVCNAGDNLVLCIPNLGASASIDTLIRDTDKEEELFSYRSNVFFSEYKKGYGKTFNIAGYPSKCNMTYSIDNSNGSILDLFAYYYSKGVGLTRLGTRYGAASAYEQYTLKDFILK